jgi:hypothetical protein
MQWEIAESIRDLVTNLPRFEDSSGALESKDAAVCRATARFLWDQASYATFHTVSARWQIRFGMLRLQRVAVVPME